MGIDTLGITVTESCKKSKVYDEGLLSFSLNKLWFRQAQDSLPLSVNYLG